MTVIQNPQPTQKPNFLPPTHPPLLRECFPVFPFLGSRVIAFKCSPDQSHSPVWRQPPFLQDLEKSRQEASLSTSGIHLARTIPSILEENPGRAWTSFHLMEPLSTCVYSLTYRVEQETEKKNEFPYLGKLFRNLIFDQSPINISPFSSHIFLPLLIAQTKSMA